jgi:hypothetical protein
MTTALRKSILSKPGGKPVRWLWPIVLCLWLAGQLAIVESSWSAETALSVIEIQIDGHAADTVSVAVIIAPGQDRAEKRTLRTGTVIEQEVGNGAEVVYQG